MKHIISSCLIGLESRYDGKSSIDRDFLFFIENAKAVPFCPEQAGGLPTPRSPSEIQNGDGFDVLDGNAKVISKDGKDVTEEFLRGAKQTLELVKHLGADTAILKSRSPSCGCRVIYDGTFSGKLREGVGVTAAMLIRHGVKVIDSDDISSCEGCNRENPHRCISPIKE